MSDWQWLKASVDIVLCVKSSKVTLPVVVQMPPPSLAASPGRSDRATRAAHIAANRPRRRAEPPTAEPFVCAHLRATARERRRELRQRSVSQRFESLSRDDRKSNRSCCARDGRRRRVQLIDGSVERRMPSSTVPLFRAAFQNRRVKPTTTTTTIQQLCARDAVSA